MTTWGSSVACSEVLGSAQEQYDDTHGFMTAVVTLRVPYGNRHALVADIVGQRLEWRKGSASVLPRAYSASIVGEQSPGAVTGDETIDYESALVTIQYSTKILDQFSESLEPFVDFQRLDPFYFCWQDGRALTSEEAPGRLVCGVNYVRTTYNLTTWSADLVNLVGYTNSDAVTWPALGRTCDPETLLYLPPTITSKVDSTNAQKFDITKKFVYKPEGWNTYRRGDTGTWERIVLRSDLSTPYNSYPLTVFNGVLV